MTIIRPDASKWTPQKRAEQITKIKNSQGSAEWYTPEWCLTAAREVMGGIELDPASNRRCNFRVKAKRYYNIFENGLARRWRAKTLWMNCPGKKHGSGQAEWQAKLIEHYEAGDVEEAIMLVYNASAVDTVWFHKLLGHYPMVIKLGRIKFDPPKGKYKKKGSQPVHGNAFVYFGKNVEKFVEVFGKFGTYVPPFQKQAAVLRIVEPVQMALFA